MSGTCSGTVPSIGSELRSVPAIGGVIVPVILALGRERFFDERIAVNHGDALVP
jgi:hypothetical protein